MVWLTTPTRTPHFGGLSGFAVRQIKHHLRRVMGQQMLNHVEFNTLIIQIETILKLRPLTALSARPNDHFNTSDSAAIPLTVQSWQITS